MGVQETLGGNLGGYLASEAKGGLGGSLGSEADAPFCRMKPRRVLGGNLGGFLCGWASWARGRGRLGVETLRLFFSYFFLTLFVDIVFGSFFFFF